MQTTMPVERIFRIAQRPERLLFLLNYDEKSDSDTSESVCCLEAMSRFQLVVLNLFGHGSCSEESLSINSMVNLDEFSAIVIHDTVKDVASLESLDLYTARKLKDFHGVKVLMRREMNLCSTTELVAYIGRTEFDLIFTSLSDPNLKNTYPAALVGNPRFERIFAENYTTTSVQRFDDLIEKALAEKGLLKKPQAFAPSAKHVLMIAGCDPLADSGPDWTSRLAPNRTKIHQLGVIARDGAAYQRRTEGGSFRWGARLKNWSSGACQRWYPLIGEDPNGRSALRELQNVRSLLDMSYESFSSRFEAPRQQLDKLRISLKFTLDCSITLVEQALDIRGISAVIASDIHSLFAGLLLKSIFKVPLLYCARNVLTADAVDRTEVELVFWKALEQKLLVYADYHQSAPTPQTEPEIDDHVILTKRADEALKHAVDRLTRDSCLTELQVFEFKRKEEEKSGTPWTMGRYQHMLAVVPDGDIYRNQKLIDLINGICNEGTRVSIICPPQNADGQENLSQLLQESASIYEVPMHMKDAEFYDLSKLLGWSPAPFFQTMLSRLMDQGVGRKFDEPINRMQLPSPVRVILRRAAGPVDAIIRSVLRKLADTLFNEVSKLRQDTAAKGMYWQHYRKRQFPPALYSKYEDVINLDCYNYFYFIKALIINKSVSTIDAVYCHCSDIWSLPVACLLKELLGVKLFYESNPIIRSALLSPAAAEAGKQNAGWMLDFVDHFIDTNKQEILQAKQDSPPTYRIDPSPVMSGARIPKTPGKLNIAVLYDESCVHIGTIYEYLNAFKLYLPHNVEYIPATANNTIPTSNVDLSLFDVVIVHYSVRLSLPAFIDANLANQLSKFSGLKLLFIQDEYETTETARSWMDRLQFDIVYTCVPQEGRELIYPSTRFPHTKFLNVLTGFVPEDSKLDDYAVPIENRKLYICYRGRILPYQYGLLGHEKYEIGIEVRRLAEERGLPVDIELDDAKRIYGADWYRFLGSSRATLGTESGSNVFDFDGKIQETIRRALDENPRRTFKYIHKKIIAEHEGPVKMNQVSPKIFEAIRLRTALILFEGTYSGVISPGVHFIPLRKDYSNINDVFEKLKDIDYLKQLTERAYNDIISSGRYSYERFVNGVNNDVQAELSRRAGLRTQLNVVNAIRE